MTALPALTPVTIPLVPIEAIAGDAELHVPPLTASANVVVAPVQITDAPVIVPAFVTSFTVTLLVA